MNAPTPPDDPRPRVLGVRFGVNPNSSSLGVDVTFLLFGGAAALAASLALSAFLRARAALKGPAVTHGTDVPAAGEPKP
jgi:hypothetical protein